MKVTPENIYNLVGGHCPGQDQCWIWVSSEVEAEVNRIIHQALTQIEPDLREIWMKREVEKQEFEEFANNRERGRQLHAKAPYAGSYYQDGKVQGLKRFTHRHLYPRWPP